MRLDSVKEFVAFFGDQFFAVSQLGLALLEVLPGDGLQVVNVVNVDVFQLVAVGINVARHGDIDQQQRPVPALAKQRLQLVAGEYVVGSRGAADDDVDRLELLFPRVKPDGSTFELLGQRDGLVVGTIGDEYTAGASAFSARAAFSLVSPAPMTSTCCDLSESKIDSANSTATELTEMLPR